MKMDRYALESESCSTAFEFISDGKNGPIHKLIHFQEIEPGFYNLAFGDKNAVGKIDDLAISNNGDREKVLATAASALYEFFNWYQTRLYMLQVAPLPEPVFTEWASQSSIKK